jgi:transcriptional regulator with XRE-family HTH domain
MAEILGKKVRQQRIRLGLSLEQLANQVGSTKAYIWQLENKKVARPSAELLLKVASALSVSPDFLVDDSAREPSKDHAADVLFRKVKQRKLTKRDIEMLISITEQMGKKKK